MMNFSLVAMSQNSHPAAEDFLVVFGWRALTILLLPDLKIFKGGPAWIWIPIPVQLPHLLELLLLPHLVSYQGQNTLQGHD